ncbi:MAG: polysaccharide deacetylase family protein [Akkermansiaceae bacterium]|nr:polysaccharide deacetylase family protein [Armatimonadota bacterium]
MLPVIAPAAKRSQRPTHILVWHDIVPDGTKIVWFDTGVDEFARQLNRLEDAGTMPVPLDALYDHLRTGQRALPAHAMVLCFDDNTRGIYDHAFPELTRRGYPFVVSAHTKFVGVRTGKDHCTWEQLREMEASGLARVVSQTHTHPPDLRTFSDSALRREMWESKIRHEENMGRTARFLTYPSGKWDKRVADAAAEAGYRLGLTEDHGSAESSPHLLGLRRWSTHKRFGEAITAIRK